MQAHSLRSRAFTIPSGAFKMRARLALRTARLTCIAAGLGTAIAAAAATDLEVEATRRGGLIEVRAKATIAAPLSVVWGTLTDYERLPDFIPGLKKSRVISRIGSTVTVEQVGEARFMFLSVPIDVTLESTERPPNIEVRRTAGSVRYLQGRYETSAASEPGHIRLRWVGAIAPETELPPLIGEALMRMSIEEQFGGMVNEIERREALRQLALALAAGRPPPPLKPAAPPPAATLQSPSGSSR